MQEMSPTQGTAGMADLTSGRANREIRPIPIEKIDVPTDARPVDAAQVNELYESILRNGLLQPIGVRRNPDKPGFSTLLWGRHRLEAFRKGFAIHGEKQGNWISIPAVFFTDKLTTTDGEIMSIIENLQRRELTAPQRDAQRTRLAALLKMQGATHENKGGRPTKGPDGGPLKPNKSLSGLQKPNTSAAVGSMTGITPTQAGISVQSTLKRARKADPNFDPDKKLNIATASPEKLKEAADLAEKRDAEIRAAQADQPKPPKAEKPATEITHAQAATLATLVHIHTQEGEAMFKALINHVWKHFHPEGRVVFNVGPNAGPV